MTTTPAVVKIPDSALPAFDAVVCVECGADGADVTLTLDPRTGCGPLANRCRRCHRALRAEVERACALRIRLADIAARWDGGDDAYDTAARALADTGMDLNRRWELFRALVAAHDGDQALVPRLLDELTGGAS